MMSSEKARFFGKPKNQIRRGFPDICILKIEQIGNPRQGFREFGVWQIVDITSTGDLKRLSQKGFVDYSEANSVGSRGVYNIFLLYGNRIYEVKQPISWKKSRHYYCRIKSGKLIEMNIHQVLAWLKNHWA